MSVASDNIDAWVSPYGPPGRILSDQGPQFMSNVFIAVMKMLGSETVRTARTILNQADKWNGKTVPWKPRGITSPTTHHDGMSYSR